jgi:hypothetical protein
MIKPDFYKNPISSYEGFTISAIQAQVSQMNALDQKSNVISSNILKYNTAFADISNNFYLNNDLSGNIEYTEKNKIKNAVQSDMNEMIFQQNNTYIIGMFTFTTILIATFLVLRS